MLGKFAAAIIVSLLTVLIASPVSAADQWPQKPITLMHGFGAGGNADTISRLVAAGLAEKLGATVTVDAKPGAGGNLASELVSRAAPDGHTLILLTGGHAVSGALYKSLRFDPVQAFSFVSLIGTFPFVVATRADSPITDLSSLIAAAKAAPGKLTFSSVGFGSTQHLVGELLSLSADIKLTHVPYRGGMQPLTDLLGGNIDLIVDTITVTRQGINGGTLRGLGVTSTEPWPTLPNVPPIGSRIPGFEVISWIGIAAPAGTPAPVIERLNGTLSALVDDAAFQQKLDDLGVRAKASSPAEMRDFVAGEIVRWNGVIDRASLQRIE
ncbi:tripartite tricarboxylate transporter substrate binding protein [Bradyrhizobium sp. Cp5.3]|uniref:tripartite tricarboxylate transporter substrate binding protein n=1 Tax=Bradyrhizobium sp. Cp5.3 TaxID=443598 RepID=UPI0004229D7F|nr:tripartite tricarboxylate transporter substrate binding protein [Bradyrhizobium sp. Cp5.3]